MLLDQIVDSFHVEDQAALGSHDLEQLAEVFARGVGHHDLVRDPTQERPVDQVLRLQVGREDNQLVERHLDLFTAGEIQVVVPLFEGHDPAVEQDRHGHRLATEVVDTERAAVGFQLQRGLADLREGVLRDLQFGHRQFPPGHHGRTHDLHPAGIDSRQVEQPLGDIVRDLLVDARIEQPHDFAVDPQRARNPDRGAEALGDPLGDAGLAVAGFAE